MSFFAYAVVLALFLGFSFGVLFMLLVEVLERRFHETSTSGTSARRLA